MTSTTNVIFGNYAGISNTQSQQIATAMQDSNTISRLADKVTMNGISVDMTLSNAPKIVKKAPKVDINVRTGTPTKIVIGG